MKTILIQLNILKDC